MPEVGAETQPEAVLSGEGRETPEVNSTVTAGSGNVAGAGAGRTLSPFVSFPRSRVPMISSSEGGGVGSMGGAVGVRWASVTDEPSGDSNGDRGSMNHLQV